MELECRLFGAFREAVGERIVHVETDAETVGDLLVDLETCYPELAGRLLEPPGDVESADGPDRTLAGTTTVTVDRRDVDHLDGLSTRLEPGVVIRLTPFVYPG